MTKKTEKVEDVQGTEATQTNGLTQTEKTQTENKEMGLIPEELMSSDKISSLLDGIEEMESSVSLNFKYLELSKGQKKRFAFMGFAELEMKDDEKSTEEDTVLKKHEAVKLLDSSRNVFVSSAVALVRIFKQSGLQLCTPVEIEHTGVSKRVKLYDVRVLR